MITSNNYKYMGNHDHSEMTHSAKCDIVDCGYVAVTHAHDDEDAVDALTFDLAEHNKSVHKIETDPEKIKDPVRAKIQRVS